VHNHALGAVGALALLDTPTVTTVHWDPARTPGRASLRLGGDLPYVAISESQRRAHADAFSWIATVPHGIDLAYFRPAPAPRRHLLHAGSLGRRKGTLEAIHIALDAGERLVVMGRPDPEDIEFFRTEIEPLFTHELIDFVGECDGAEKLWYFQRAKALIHPIAWPEPFGLVYAEALACGVPVLTIDRGAAAELVRHGETGYVAAEWRELVEQVRRVARYAADDCRDSVGHLSADAMVERYLEVYATLAA
jgi:glycosyltransferase involved in cell wall biosynthesis